MSETALQARDLCKRLGRRNVLDGVEFELSRGRIAALFGANGAGKTTLLRVLAGIALPSRGVVEVDGARDRRRARAAVGYVGHDTMLYASLSAAENLRFAARLYGQPADRVTELLRAVELDAVADQAAGSFSRGMCSAWPSRARRSTNRRCCCSMSPSTPSTPAPPSRWKRRWARCASEAPRCVW